MFTFRRTLAALALGALAAPLGAPAHAQTQPSQRVMRTYVPADQLVSFQADVSFDRFMETLAPIFERVTGKGIVNPEARTEAIGVPVQGMHFFDAFVYVLAARRLSYRENDRYFVVADAQQSDVVLSANEAAGRVPRGTEGPVVTGNEVMTPAPANLVLGAGSREVRISAVLFDLNLTKARDLGINWSALIGGAESGGGGGGDTPVIAVRTGDFFDRFNGRITGPEELTFTTLTQLFRALETEGVGRTIANPQITVQSGKKGRIQIGSDVPIQTRDFSGNTITQLISTGIIVDVTPTLVEAALTDSAGAPTLSFMDLDVTVEKSSSRPSGSGPVIDRNQAATRILLLDGEQTIIGGLYSTETSRQKKGILLLKDIPILGRLFSYQQTTETQRELLIVMQAELMDDLATRDAAPRGAEDLLEQRRQEVRQNLRRVSPNLMDQTRPVVQQ